MSRNGGRADSRVLAGLAGSDSAYTNKCTYTVVEMQPSGSITPLWRLRVCGTCLQRHTRSTASRAGSEPEAPVLGGVVWHEAEEKGEVPVFHAMVVMMLVLYALIFRCYV